MAGRIENDLGRRGGRVRRSALGKVAVIANVNADFADLGVENRCAEVAGAEVELLPKARLAMRHVQLAELSQVFAGRVDHGGRVVIKRR